MAFWFAANRRLFIESLHQKWILKRHFTYAFGHCRGWMQEPLLFSERFRHETFFRRVNVVNNFSLFILARLCGRDNIARLILKAFCFFLVLDSTNFQNLRLLLKSCKELQLAQLFMSSKFWCVAAFKPSKAQIRPSVKFSLAPFCSQEKLKIGRDITPPPAPPASKILWKVGYVSKL